MFLGRACTPPGGTCVSDLHLGHLTVFPAESFCYKEYKMYVHMIINEVVCLLEIPNKQNTQTAQNYTTPPQPQRHLLP